MSIELHKKMRVVRSWLEQAHAASKRKLLLVSRTSDELILNLPMPRARERLETSRLVARRRDRITIHLFGRQLVVHGTRLPSTDPPPRRWELPRDDARSCWARFSLPFDVEAQRISTSASDEGFRIKVSRREASTPLA